MSVKSTPNADFNFAATIMEFIRKEPLQQYEHGGMVDRIDLVLCFDYTLSKLMARYAEKFPSDVQGLDGMERSINSALPVLMAAYAERHRFPYEKNPASGFRFSIKHAVSAPLPAVEDELAERLCALDRLLEGNNSGNRKQRILRTAKEVFRDICKGSERIDFALGLLSPLVESKRLSQDMAVSLLVPFLDKSGEVEFLDPGWLRIVEAVSVCHAALTTELYWHRFVRHALYYGGGVPDRPLLLRAIRASDPFWMRAVRDTERTRHAWNMSKFRADLRFTSDGRIYVAARVKRSDKAKQNMIALLDGIEDAGVRPNDLLPINQDLIRESMAGHAPAEGGAIKDESLWANWALAAARSKQLAEFSDFIKRFNLIAENVVHAWLMRRWLADCGSVYRSAAVDELALHARIPHARADQILSKVSLGVDELLGAWQRTSGSGAEMNFAEFIRTAALVQGSAADRIAGLATASAPAGYEFMKEIGMQLEKVMPEVSVAGALSPVSEEVNAARTAVSPEDLAWAAQVAGSSVRAMILKMHRSALSQFAMAVDLRSKSAEEDLLDLVRNLCQIAGAAMTLPEDDAKLFFKSLMEMAAEAATLLVAREMQLGHWVKHSNARMQNFIKNRFRDIAAKPVFPVLSAAISAAATAGIINDAQALRLVKGYDVLGVLKSHERQLMMASLREPYSDVSGLVAHWDQTCARLQRIPAFDEAFFASVAVLNDVEAANAARRAVDGDEFGNLLWKVRRTWAILALRNGTRIRSMRAIYDRMAVIQPALRKIEFDEFKAAMAAHDQDEVPLEKAIQFYAAKMAGPAPAGTSPLPVSPQEHAAEASDTQADEPVAEAQSSAECAAQAAFAGGLGIAGLTVKPA